MEVEPVDVEAANEIKAKYFKDHPVNIIRLVGLTTPVQDFLAGGDVILWIQCLHSGFYHWQIHGALEMDRHEGEKSGRSTRWCIENSDGRRFSMIKSKSSTKSVQLGGGLSNADFNVFVLTQRICQKVLHDRMVELDRADKLIDWKKEDEYRRLVLARRQGQTEEMTRIRRSLEESGYIGGTRPVLDPSWVPSDHVPARPSQGSQGSQGGGRRGSGLGAPRPQGRFVCRSRDPFVALLASMFAEQLRQEAQLGQEAQAGRVSVGARGGGADNARSQEKPRTPFELIVLDGKQGYDARRRDVEVRRVLKSRCRASCGARGGTFGAEPPACATCAKDPAASAGQAAAAGRAGGRLPGKGSAHAKEAGGAQACGGAGREARSR